VKPYFKLRCLRSQLSFFFEKIIESCFPDTSCSFGNMFVIVSSDKIFIWFGFRFFIFIFVITTDYKNVNLCTSCISAYDDFYLINFESVLWSLAAFFNLAAIFFSAASRNFVPCPDGVFLNIGSLLNLIKSFLKVLSLFQ